MRVGEGPKRAQVPSLFGEAALEVGASPSRYKREVYFLMTIFVARIVVIEE